MKASEKFNLFPRNISANSAIMEIIDNGYQK